MKFGHGGNQKELASKAGCSPEELLDFSANINPLGPPEALRATISRSLSRICHYPDPNSSSLVKEIAVHHGVPEASIVVGNGSTELLYALPAVLAATTALIPVPSYIDYTRAAERVELRTQRVALCSPENLFLDLATLGEHIQEGQLVFIGQPNNPNGALCESLALRKLAEAHPHTFFVIDEAFADFVDGYTSIACAALDNVVVLRSMTKFYAIPGLRLGYAIAPPEIAQRLRETITPWSVNVLAQAVGTMCLSGERYAEMTRAAVPPLRKELASELARIPGFKVFPSTVNYLLLRIDQPSWSAPRLAEELLRRRIAIRVCDNYEGLDERFFRVAVRTREENERLCQAIAQILGAPPRRAPAKPRTPALMFQGTASNAGKSVLVSALCRILLQDGVRVAPFKAQNMSLNSFVTHDGLELGRAQAVQAQACKLDPDARMNPILLKPNSDTGSQVILHGKPVGNMHVEEYIRFKPEAFRAVAESYDSLAGEFDALIIEGAGSPGEVNLKSHDIVNMQMARYANAPVLLVGDIDRGGVFASFVGTMEVLSEWERSLIAGFVVNRFRGNAALLDDAYFYMRRHTGKPVLGTVPFIKDLALPEEDSVEFKSGALDEAARGEDSVEVAVIDFPHISNFTDLDALRIEDDVHLRIVRNLSDLDQPAAIILPGSKSVIADLAYLRKSGLAARILELAEKKQTQIVGICGGFQMLGQEICDPHRIESTCETRQGLCLLPMQTTLELEKTLTRSTGTHVASGCPIFGYEIHHGASTAADLITTIAASDGTSLGHGLEDHRVWGTYVHGLFDADGFRRWFIDRLRVSRGLAPRGEICAAYDIAPALDRLAAVVRESLPMDKVYRIMGL